MRMIRSNITLYFERKNCSKPGSKKSFVKYLGIIMSISRIGIIGAGQMGTGIAHVMALANYDVILNDVLPEHLISAKTTISQNLDRQISANKISGDEASKAMSLVKTSVDLEAVANTDLIIEAVNEEEELKRKVFLSIMPYLREDTVLTSNTSSISITRLAVLQTDQKISRFSFYEPSSDNAACRAYSWYSNYSRYI